MKYCGIIHVTDNYVLPTLRRNDWNVGEMRKVLFFKNKITPVYLTSVDHPDFLEHLKLIDVDEPICIDLEWRVSYSARFQFHVSLFQFSTSDCALLVRHLPSKPSAELKEFLVSHKFIGKSIGNDKRKLRDLFGPDMEIDIEDIVSTRLIPNGFSKNFHDLVNTFVGPPLFSIKDKTVTLSNWERPNLAIIQVLYSAFDVVALTHALKRLPLPQEKQISKQPKQKEPRRKRISWRSLPKVFKRPSECASALYEITFPRSVGCPDEIPMKDESDITPDMALKMTLSVFGIDDDIPSTLTITYSENIPDDIFDSQVYETQKSEIQDGMPSLLSSSDEEYDFIPEIDEDL